MDERMPSRALLSWDIPGLPRPLPSNRWNPLTHRERHRPRAAHESVYRGLDPTGRPTAVTSVSAVSSGASARARLPLPVHPFATAAPAPGSTLAAATERQRQEAAVGVMLHVDERYLLAHAHAPRTASTRPRLWQGPAETALLAEYHRARAAGVPASSEAEAAAARAYGDAEPLPNFGEHMIAKARAARASAAEGAHKKQRRQKRSRGPVVKRPRSGARAGAAVKFANDDDDSDAASVDSSSGGDAADDSDGDSSAIAEEERDAEMSETDYEALDANLLDAGQRRRPSRRETAAPRVAGLPRVRFRSNLTSSVVDPVNPSLYDAQPDRDGYTAPPLRHLAFIHSQARVPPALAAALATGAAPLAVDRRRVFGLPARPPPLTITAALASTAPEGWDGADDTAAVLRAMSALAYVVPRTDVATGVAAAARSIPSAAAAAAMAAVSAAGVDACDDDNADAGGLSSADGGSGPNAGRDRMFIHAASLKHDKSWLFEFTSVGPAATATTAVLAPPRCLSTGVDSNSAVPLAGITASTSLAPGATAATLLSCGLPMPLHAPVSAAGAVVERQTEDPCSAGVTQRVDAEEESVAWGTHTVPVRGKVEVRAVPAFALGPTPYADCTATPAQPPSLRRRGVAPIVAPASALALASASLSTVTGAGRSGATVTVLTVGGRVMRTVGDLLAAMHAAHTAPSDKGARDDEDFDDGVVTMVEVASLDPTAPLPPYPPLHPASTTLAAANAAGLYAAPAAWLATRHISPVGISNDLEFMLRSLPPTAPVESSASVAATVATPLLASSAPLQPSEVMALALELVCRVLAQARGCPVSRVRAAVADARLRGAMESQAAAAALYGRDGDAVLEMLDRADDDDGADGDGGDALYRDTVAQLRSGLAASMTTRVRGALPKQSVLRARAMRERRLRKSKRNLAAPGSWFEDLDEKQRAAVLLATVTGTDAPAIVESASESESDSASDLDEVVDVEEKDASTAPVSAAQRKMTDDESATATVADMSADEYHALRKKKRVPRETKRKSRTPHDGASVPGYRGMRGASASFASILAGVDALMNLDAPQMDRLVSRTARATLLRPEPPLFIGAALVAPHGLARVPAHTDTALAYATTGSVDAAGTGASTGAGLLLLQCGPKGQLLGQPFAVLEYDRAATGGNAGTGNSATSAVTAGALATEAAEMAVVSAIEEAEALYCSAPNSSSDTDGSNDAHAITTSTNDTGIVKSEFAQTAASAASEDPSLWPALPPWHAHLARSNTGHSSSSDARALAAVSGSISALQSNAHDATAEGLDGAISTVSARPVHALLHVAPLLGGTHAASHGVVSVKTESGEVQVKSDINALFASVLRSSGGSSHEVNALLPTAQAAANDGQPLSTSDSSANAATDGTDAAVVTVGDAMALLRAHSATVLPFLAQPQPLALVVRLLLLLTEADLAVGRGGTSHSRLAAAAAVSAAAAPSAPAARAPMARAAAAVVAALRRCVSHARRVVTVGRTAAEAAHYRRARRDRAAQVALVSGTASIAAMDDDGDGEADTDDDDNHSDEPWLARVPLLDGDAEDALAAAGARWTDAKSFAAVANAAPLPPPPPPLYAHYQAAPTDATAAAARDAALGAREQYGSFAPCSCGATRGSARASHAHRTRRGDAAADAVAAAQLRLLPGVALSLEPPRFCGSLACLSLQTCLVYSVLPHDTFPLTVTTGAEPAAAAHSETQAPTDGVSSAAFGSVAAGAAPDAAAAFTSGVAAALFSPTASQSVTSAPSGPAPASVSAGVNSVAPLPLPSMSRAMSRVFSQGISLSQQSPGAAHPRQRLAALAGSQSRPGSLVTADAHGAGEDAGEDLTQNVEFLLSLTSDTQQFSQQFSQESSQPYSPRYSQQASQQPTRTRNTLAGLASVAEEQGSGSEDEFVNAYSPQAPQQQQFPLTQPIGSPVAGDGDSYDGPSASANAGWVAEQRRRVEEAAHVRFLAARVDDPVSTAQDTATTTITVSGAGLALGQYASVTSGAVDGTATVGAVARGAVTVGDMMLAGLANLWVEQEADEVDVLMRPRRARTETEGESSKKN